MAIGVGMLVVAMWVVTLALPDPRPPTVEAAAAKIETYFDRVEHSLAPGSIRERSEEVAEVPCPLEDSGGQAKVRRTLHIDPDVDRVAWVARLDEVFPEADGWVVRVRTLDSRENLRVRVVGQDLTIIDITALASDGEARITLRSTSECSQRP
jgi:hypothetical protein